LGAVIVWYLVISIAGWLSFPLAFHLLPGLHDRGYTFSRALGLLLWGYVFWLLASLGILRNDSTGLLFSLALVVALSLWTLRRASLDELRTWWQAQRRLVLVTELLFLAAFIAWALVRGANPEAVGTEKPMELAFINAILSSPTFPPHDPWLSGYAISYYYFGYVLVAMLAKITATSGAIAFNLGISLIFALSAIGAYGLVYNLLNALLSRGKPVGKPRRAHFTLAALFGPLYALIVSNLEGFLYFLYSMKLFWRRDASGALTSAFWQWLDIKDLNIPPQEQFSHFLDRFWWWWRASRVLQDYDLAGNVKEIIDEFPFFSYLLADLHPHVLIMPFTFLAIALALNIFLTPENGSLGWQRLSINNRTLAWAGILALPLGILFVVRGALALSVARFGLGVLALLFGGGVLVFLRQNISEYGLRILVRSDLGEISLQAQLHIDAPFFLLAAIALGGMAFLNTWDFPFYVALFAAAYALARMLVQGKSLPAVLMDFVWMGLALGVSGGLLYLPFYLGFSSQAGGVLPNLINPTRGAHLWVMFAPLLVPIFAFLVYLGSGRGKRRFLIGGFKLALGFVLLLWILSLLLGVAILIVPGVGALFQSSLAAPAIAPIFQAALLRRFVSLGGWLTLLVLLGLVLSLFLRLKVGEGTSPDAYDQEIEAEPSSQSIDPASPRSLPYAFSTIFALLLILWGTLFVLGPEFFYLRDMFGWRMNTIFKFYYQAWLLWSVAAAYMSVVLFKKLRGRWGAVFSIAWLLVTGMALFYPALSLYSKTNGFRPTTWTLDSAAYLAESSPDEMDAIRWLANAPPGVVAEAVPPSGGSYSQFGRVSEMSGQPAVLGWIGHESQWRGGGLVMGSRQSDLERLYCTRDWSEAQVILDQYAVRYVFIGSLERSNYQPGDGACPLGVVETKFASHIVPVFQQGEVTIYEYNPPRRQE
jgi:uncharacterized membrane protein